MPVFALAYLHDALVARGSTRGDTPARLADLRRRMSNAILPEAGSAHVEELTDPYLLWFWNSNVRSTAIVLNTLVQAGADRAPMSADRPLDDGGAEGRPLGQHAGERLRDGGARRLLPEVRERRADFRAVVTLGAERARARAVPRALDRVDDDGRADGRRCSPPARPGTTQPLTFTTRGRRHAVLHDAPALRRRSAVPGRPRQRLPHRAHATRRTSRPAARPAPTTLQGRRSRAGHADVHADQGAPLRRGHRSAAGRLRAGRVVVRDDGGDARARSRTIRGTLRDDWTAWWQRGGFDHVERHDDRVQLFATRLSEGHHEFSYVVRATTAGTFRTAPARAEEMYEPEVFGRTATTVIEVKRVTAHGSSCCRAPACHRAVVGAVVLLAAAAWLRLGPLPAGAARRVRARRRPSSSIATACRCTRRCRATARAASGSTADALPPVAGGGDGRRGGSPLLPPPRHRSAGHRCARSSGTSSSGRSSKAARRSRSRWRSCC